MVRKATTEERIKDLFLRVRKIRAGQTPTPTPSDCAVFGMFKFGERTFGCDE